MVQTVKSCGALFKIVVIGGVWHGKKKMLTL